MSNKELLREINKDQLPRIIIPPSVGEDGSYTDRTIPLQQYLEALELRIRELEDRKYNHVHSIVHPGGLDDPYDFGGLE